MTSLLRKFHAMRPTARAEGGVSADVASQPTTGNGRSEEGVADDADLSPRARRKRSHKAVEVERRQRISRQLDRLIARAAGAAPADCDESCVVG